MGEADLIRDYESRYPGTGVSDAQKLERAERLAFKDERRSLRRTGRQRGIVVPDLPWLREREGD